MTKKEQLSINDLIEGVHDELDSRYENWRKGYKSKFFKPRGGNFPINNPYENVSERKLRTAYTFLRKVFDHYEKPYWVNVTLNYPPQLPNCSKTIRSCMRSLMNRKNKLASHYIVATEAGIKNNRYHHHVFIYAGSFASVCKAEAKLKRLWGEILCERFGNIFEECAASDAFDTAHIYTINGDNDLLNSENLYRECLRKEAWKATRSPLSQKSFIGNVKEGDYQNNFKIDHYQERENTSENYSKLAWSSRPSFQSFDDDKWMKEAFYHLSYICKKANKLIPERRLMTRLTKGVNKD